MCEFYDCNCNGFGDIWWTDKLIYFSIIDGRMRFFFRCMHMVKDDLQLSRFVG